MTTAMGGSHHGRWNMGTNTAVHTAEDATSPDTHHDLGMLRQPDASPSDSEAVRPLHNRKMYAIREHPMALPYHISLKCCLPNLQPSQGQPTSNLFTAL